MIPRSVWPFTFTFRHSFTTLPSVSSINVLRSIPIYSLPKFFFSFHTSNALANSFSSSANNKNGNPCFSINFSCLEIGSGLTPSITVFNSKSLHDDHGNHMPLLYIRVSYLLDKSKGQHFSLEIRLNLQFLHYLLVRQYQVLFGQLVLTFNIPPS